MIAALKTIPSGREIPAGNSKAEIPNQKNEIPNPSFLRTFIFLPTSYYEF
jgi:hypothetical protein